MFDERKGQGATEYLLILAAVLVIAASAVYFVTQTGGYPAVGVHAEARDNDIYLNVSTGSIPAGEWTVEIDGDPADPNNDAFENALEQPGILLEGALEEESGSVSVTLIHDPTGHVYNEWTLTAPDND